MNSDERYLGDLGKNKSLKIQVWIYRVGTLWVTSLLFVKGAPAGSCQVVLGFVCKASWAPRSGRGSLHSAMVFHVPALRLSSFQLRKKFRESQGLMGGINNAKLLPCGAACSSEVSHGAGLGVCTPQQPGLASSPGLLPAPSPTLEPSTGGSGCVSSIWIWCADFQQETKQPPQEHNFGPNGACLQYKDECVDLLVCRLRFLHPHTSKS